MHEKRLMASLHQTIWRAYR